jgi:hypothetical protein
MCLPVWFVAEYCCGATAALTSTPLTSLSINSIYSMYNYQSQPMQADTSWDSLYCGADVCMW